MAKDTLTYKGFTGSIEASLEDECLNGRILFIDDLITYEGNTIPQIKTAFQEAVNRYLAYCEKTGKPANKPYSGTFNIRVGEELHRSAAMAAGKADVSLNDWICQALNMVLSPEKASNHTHTHFITVQLPGELERFIAPSSKPTEWTKSNVTTTDALH